MLILRDVQDNDIEYFMKVWRDKDLIASTSGDFTDYSDRELKAWFRVKGNPLGKIICVDNKIVGDVSLTKEAGGWYELGVRIAEEPYRNKGYGTEAIGQMLDLARQHGFNKICLQARPENARAIKVYKNFGFKKSGTPASTDFYERYDLFL